jgi:hypothetical protein
VENLIAKFLTGFKRAVTCPFPSKLLQLSYCIAMGSKKRVVLDLNAKVKVTEESETVKLTVKKIVGKFKTGKT